MSIQSFLAAGLRTTLACMVIALCSSPMLAQDVSTSFEFDDTDGTFSVGESPNSVTFEGGEAKVVGIPSLYRTGSHSFMVAPGDTATITFETPAAEFTLYLLDQDDTVQSVLTVMDENDNVLDTFNGTTGDFQEITMSNTSVKTITLENMAPADGPSVYANIDDFSFTAVDQQVDGEDPVLVFTQFVNGIDPAQPGEVQNRTRIILRNNDDEAVSGTVRFKGLAEPLEVPVGGMNVTSVEFDLAPFSSTEIVTDGTGDLISGVVEVHVDEGNPDLLEGTLIFDLLGAFVSVNAVPVRSTHQVYVAFATDVENTGVAIYNPDAEETSTFQIVMLNNLGEVQVSREFMLGPMEQLVAFVTEETFFMDILDGLDDFFGTLNIVVTDGPDIAVLGLIQTPDGRLIAVDTGANVFLE